MQHFLLMIYLFIVFIATCSTITLKLIHHLNHTVSCYFPPIIPPFHSSFHSFFHEHLLKLYTMPTLVVGPTSSIAPTIH